MKDDEMDRQLDAFYDVPLYYNCHNCGERVHEEQTEVVDYHRVCLDCFDRMVKDGE